MSLNIDKEIAQMQIMPVNELVQMYEKVFEESTRSRNRNWLIKRIAWRMQANEYGGLSDRALARAKEIANVADLRLMPPREDTSVVRRALQPVRIKPAVVKDRRVPPPGNYITKKYKGVEHDVFVEQGHFVWQGDKYASLSAVAKAITGQHWNGYKFFGLTRSEAC